MKSALMIEASMVDLDNEQLKEFLGYLHESIKSLSDEMKKDPELQQLQDAVKAYKRDNFSDEIKRLSAKLKAARAQAHARGVKWSPPSN
jgi:hypothetical protein